MLEDLMGERKKKLLKLEEAGIAPYPVSAKRTHEIGAVLEGFTKLAKAKKKIAITGRAMAVRDMGKVLFIDLRDGSGQLQIVAKSDTLKNFTLLQATLDRGDFIGCEGTLFITKRGEKSLEAKNWQMLSKSIRPLPDKWGGIEEIDARLRERYLDILLSPETAELFRKKAIFWNTFREYLVRENFLEVEMPVLENTTGGAEAEPFVTHYNALDQDFFLRISLELPLKKMLVAGYERVFEIGRIFRNEGIDKEHLQDYTQLEFYWAYRDYKDLMVTLEKMYKEVIKKTTGGLVTEWNGEKINWGKKWKKVDYVEVFKKANKIDPLEATQHELLAHAKKLNLEVEPHMGRGRLIDLIYKKTVRPFLIEPCFLIDPPVVIEPLAKRTARDPRRVERLQIVAGGTELGKGFSELNDPQDQRGRFEEQVKLREAGDKEAQQLDEEFLRALEYGMPPAAGFGISERLFAVLMGKPTRETVIFPPMRARGNQEL